MSIPSANQINPVQTHKIHHHTIVQPQQTQPDFTATYPTDGNVSGQTGKLVEVETIRKALHLSQNNPTLWEVLDKGRMEMHHQVIKNTFLQGLVNGTFCESAFMKYLNNLLVVHEALEKAQQKLVVIPHLKEFVVPELYRSAGIKKDLLIWNFVADSKFVPWKPSQEALDFVEYITKLSNTDPEGVVGIMYALYGTVMSGGQTNKKFVFAKLQQIKEYTENVPEGSGVSLYEIKREKVLSDGEIAEFKKEWHMQLCKVQALRPINEEGMHEFHVKLQTEVNNTFKVILQIIEKDIQAIC